MNRKFGTVLLSTLTVLAFAGSIARADYVPFSYNFTPINPNTNSVLTNVYSDTVNSPGMSPQPSKLTLSNEPGVPEAASSDIVATNISTWSTASRNNEDVFVDNGPGGVSSGAFKLRLNIVDLETGMGTTLDFAGRFFGVLSATSSGIKVAWDGDYSEGAAVPFVLGNSEYTVYFAGYAPPGPPSAQQKGSITFHVEARPLDLQKAPEPSTMVLSCVGLMSMGLAAWRKRRQQKKADLEAAI